MGSTTCITFWVKGLELVFADVNKQMGIIKNHSPWSVLNRYLDTLKRRVVRGHIQTILEKINVIMTLGGEGV